MRAIWYGDRRDRVKWGALLHLAETYDLSPILQVAYARDEPSEEERLLTLDGDGRTAPISKVVWNHFSRLDAVELLGQATGRMINVRMEHFDSSKRKEYVRAVISDFERHQQPKLLFLDPDTGIQRDKTAEDRHATVTDIHEFWRALNRGDVLAVYQHASRRPRWILDRSRMLSIACNHSQVSAITARAIAGDVAILWTRKR